MSALADATSRRPQAGHAWETAGRPEHVPAAHEAVLATLAYYHLFKFPLTLEETHRLSGHRGSLASTEAAVGWLESRGVVGREDGHIFLGESTQVAERKIAESRAAEAATRIHARARMIGGFPFVRGVGLSGSASKGILKPGDDVDFFVITAPGRLWVCRALLMLFKKVFLLNSHRMFCVNYLVSADLLTLPDRNVFTAMEIAWLRPAWGNRWYEEFLAANRWLAEFLPNWRAFEDSVPSHPAGAIKRSIESALSGPFGAHADAWVRAKITERNRRKYRHLSPSDFEIAFRSEPHASKHHPGHHQGRVTDRYYAEIQKWRALIAKTA